MRMTCILLSDTGNGNCTIRDLLVIGASGASPSPSAQRCTAYVYRVCMYPYGRHDICFCTHDHLPTLCACAQQASYIMAMKLRQDSGHRHACRRSQQLILAKNLYFIRISQSNACTYICTWVQHGLVIINLAPNLALPVRLCSQLFPMQLLLCNILGHVVYL